MYQPEKPRIETEIRRSTHDHEVLLSFNNDDDAFSFVEWWDTYGWKAFLAEFQQDGDE